MTRKFNHTILGMLRKGMLSSNIPIRNPHASTPVMVEARCMAFIFVNRLRLQPAQPFAVKRLAGFPRR
jgi:hypothetical protein